MVGPYATLRLTEHLFWQARAAWGRSNNEVSPFLTYTDKFETDRWLVSSTLTGRWNFGPWVFRPSLSMAYMEDAAKSYTDTFGAVIPEVKSRLGQAKAGPEIAPLPLQGQSRRDNRAACGVAGHLELCRRRDE